jgi:hypothetical protein
MRNIVVSVVLPDMKICPSRKERTEAEDVRGNGAEEGV